jgi:putative ABC transport system permease protein
MSGTDRLDMVFLRADDPRNVSEVEFQIREMLKRTHEHGNEFRINTGESQLEQFNRVVLIMKMVAGGIAGISLIVGGIGIMNIMLVSVAERTREIGVRMAVGAKRSAIMLQFILESMVLCLFGGGMGVVLGIVIGKGLEIYIQSLGDNPFASLVTPQLMMFAVGYSAIVGVFFGVYPAWRASKMDPVEALRQD